MYSFIIIRVLFQLTSGFWGCMFAAEVDWYENINQNNIQKNQNYQFLRKPIIQKSCWKQTSNISQLLFSKFLRNKPIQSLKIQAFRPDWNNDLTHTPKKLIPLQKGIFVLVEKSSSRLFILPHPNHHHFPFKNIF